MQLNLDLFEVNKIKGNIITLNSNFGNSKLLDRVRPPIRYPGSKFNAAKFIAPFWNLIDHDEYREPFLGSGAIFFTKPKTNISWLNDLDKDLITTFKVIQNSKSRNLLISKIKDFIPSKEKFEYLKYFNPTNEIEIAYRYFVINRTAYSGIMKLPNWGFHPTKSVQPNKWPHRIEIAGKKLEGVELTSFDYKKVFKGTKKGHRIFFFVDPPYYKADQKRAYVHSFLTKDHLELNEILKKLKHPFCLTYDNCIEVKELYNWARIHEIEWRYHTSNSNNTTRKMGKELIITNF